MEQQKNHFLPHIHPKLSSSNLPSKIIKISSKSSLHRPFSYLRSEGYIQSRAEYEENRHRYYKDGYSYQTEYEKEKQENQSRKSKFLNGNFQGYCGIASEMPVRKEGLIRTGSEYLSPIQPHPKDKHIPLYGVWQPTKL